ncbi:MAG: hypothetical protein HY553_17165 [Elusimicrobia bacterium]|nr:hypothetical protein [Elusimicrobiota bacterium]
MGRLSYGGAGPSLVNPPPRHALRLAILVLALAAPAAVRAQFAGASIDFIPPGGVREGQSVALRATFNSGVPPSYAYVFVRPIGQSAYLPLVLRINGNGLFGELPSAMLQAPGIEYYLSVIDIDNQTVTLPAVSPEASPLRLPVAPRPGGFALTPVFPHEGAAVHEPSPWFHFEYAGAAGGLDTASFQLAVDGRRVTTPCQFEEGELFCSIGWELALGTHSAVARVQRLSDGQAVEAAFAFTRGAAPRARPRPHGKAVAHLVYVSVPNAPSQPSQMLIPAERDRVFPEFDLDSDMRVSSASLRILVRHVGIDRQEQPSPNRYAITIEGDAANLDLGDSIAVWSDLGLSQMRLRGAQGGVSFAGGRVRLEAAAGQTRRAIDRPELNTAVLARHLLGVSASAKLGRHGLRLYVLDVRDDGASVRKRGSLDPIGTRQAGVAASFGLPAGCKAEAELGFAAYQPRLGGPETVKGRGTQASFAQDGESISWSVLARETRPGFVPLGNETVQADYRGAEMQGSARLLGGKAVLSASGQIYRDNTEEQKPLTFHALFHQSNLMLQTWAGGPSVLLGFGEQRQRTASTTIPLLRSGNTNWLAGLTQSLGRVSVGYNFGLSSYRDRSPQPFSNSFDLRTHSLNAAWRGPHAGLAVSGQHGVNSDLGTGNRSRTLGFTVRTNASRGPLRLDASHTQSVGKDQGNSIDNRQSDSAGQLEWRFGGERFVRLGFEVVSYTNRFRPVQSYKETRSALSYGFSF